MEASGPADLLRPLSEDVNAHDLTIHQLFTLKLVSLVAGSVSVLSVLAISCWFVRMRRRFRHNLIMLLLQSDMLKGLWFMIYPAVELANGRVLSESIFCQASGFFLTLGIEACDIAVLLIATHTALHIYRRSNANGLYPFRKYAFAAFAGVPVLLTSLAFLNTPAFANSGEYCYLPMRPNWTRMALSWIPRYFVFGTLLTMYVCINFHVRFVTRQFDARPSTRGNSASPSIGRSPWEPKHTASVPPLPLIQRHGLVPTPVPSATGSTDGGRRRNSLASAIGNVFSRRPSASTQLINMPRRPVLRWKLPSFKLRDQSEAPEFEAGAAATRRRASSASSRPVPSLTHAGTRLKGRTPKLGLDAHGSDHSHPSLPMFDEAGPSGPRRHTVPCVLPLQAVDIELQELRRKVSSSEASVKKAAPGRRPKRLSVSTDAVDFQGRAQLSSDSNEAAAFNDSDISPAMSAANMHQTQVGPNAFASSDSPATQTFWNRPLADFSQETSRSPSLTNIFMALRRSARGSGRSSSVFLSPRVLAQTGMAKHREALRKQTRQLLIYPAVYLAVWICPFVSHLLGGRDVPFPLMIASLFSLSIQGAADALVFALREKPWEQIKSDLEDQGGHQLRAWWRADRDSQTADFGQTPDEALANERMARRRLNDEIEQRRSEKNGSERHFMARGAVTDWWELRAGQQSL